MKLPELVTVSGTAHVTPLCSTSRLLTTFHASGGLRVFGAFTWPNTVVSSEPAPRSFAADLASSGRAHRRVTGARGGQPCPPRPRSLSIALTPSEPPFVFFPLSQPCTKAAVIWREANPSPAVYCGTEPFQLREAPCKAERGLRPALYPG